MQQAQPDGAATILGVKVFKETVLVGEWSLGTKQTSGNSKFEKDLIALDPVMAKALGCEMAFPSSKGFATLQCYCQICRSS